MNTSKYILAIDLGTTSCRAILFDSQHRIVDIEQKEFTQYFPNQGWVEHDALEIFELQVAVIRLLFSRNEIQKGDIKTIGITNQRETVVLWNRNTGLPIHRAIVWQDTRTSERCEAIKQDRKLKKYIHKTTGLIVDSYFSASKIEWLLTSCKEAKEALEKGELLAGTIDSWLLWKLTDGKVHATDVTNASRTMLFDIIKLQWDEKLLHLFHIPISILPEVKPSSSMFGTTELFQGFSIPITGIAGDQQASLFGHGCLEAGMVKNTYGTGCFILTNTGEKPVFSNHGLLTTIAWQINGKVSYALEGSVFMAGATIQWLRDSLGIISKASETEELASKVSDNGGVYFVPAFAGLGAPYWDMNARGAIFGLTRATQKEHIARAALESIAFQTTDVLEVIKAESNLEISVLAVDGGASKNNFLMQFQADVLGVEVARNDNSETTARGVALLAENYFNILGNHDPNEYVHFYPTLNSIEKKKLITGWKEAVKRVFTEEKTQK